MALDLKYLQAMISESPFEYLLNQGAAWSASKQAVLADEATISFSFKTPAGSLNDIWLLFDARASGAANIKLLEGGAITLTSGTLLALDDRNRITQNTSAIRGHNTAALVAGSVTLGGTIAAGDVIYEEHFGVTRQGGVHDPTHLIILARDTEYQLLLTSEAAANDCVLGIGPFEVPEIP